MASADFLTINLVWATAAIFMAPALSVRPPRVRTHSFSPPTCRIYPWGFRVIMGLQSVLRPYPSQIGLMRFLFVRSEICLHLPSDSTSRCRFWCSAMTYSNSLRTCILKSAPMPGAQRKNTPLKKHKWGVFSSKIIVPLTSYKIYGVS